MEDCDTLDAVDEVCKAVTRCGLEKISCFDAFLFHKILVSKSLDKYKEELDKAYAIFLDMTNRSSRMLCPAVIAACILLSTRASSASELDAPAILKSLSKDNVTLV